MISGVKVGLVGSKGQAEFCGSTSLAVVLDPHLRTDLAQMAVLVGCEKYVV